MTHIDEDALTEYAVADGRNRSASAAIAGHLNECEECQARYGRIAAFFDALTSPDMWEAADAGAAVAANQRAILEFAARSQQEYAEAARALAPLLADTVGFIRERIERDEGYRTGGTVRVLSEAANDAFERNPLHARNLADAAVVIAEQLSTDDYPLDTVHTLRGLAWKERANALRFLAEYPAALDALSRPARILPPRPARLRAGQPRVHPGRRAHLHGPPRRSDNASGRKCKDFCRVWRRRALDACAQRRGGSAVLPTGVRGSGGRF